MAQVISADQQVLNFSKYWYTDKKFENLLMRNDPFGEMLPKNRIGGQAYRFAALYGRGGNVSGSFLIAQTIAANQSQSKNAEWIVPPGRIFSVFNITQMELLATQSDKGAYIKALENKFFAGTEALRKTFGKALYGYGYGEQALLGGLYGFGVAQAVNTATATNVAYATVPTSMKAGLTSAGISGVPTGVGVGPFPGLISVGTYASSTYTPGTGGTGFTYSDAGVIASTDGAMDSFKWQFSSTSDIMGIDIGSVVQFTIPTTTGTPADGLGTNSALFFNVVEINGTQVTFVSVNGATATPYSAATPVTLLSKGLKLQCGSWMVLAGAFDANGPSFPYGLSQIHPFVGNRGVLGTFNPSGTGSSTATTLWDTYINTTYCGMARKNAVDRLAGSFVMNTTGLALSDAVMEGLRLARRNGARNADMAVLVNDVDMKYIINELGGVSTNKTTYFQDVGSGGSKKQSVQKGLSDINFQFLTSWLDKIVDSPYIPQGVCWIIDKSNMELVVLSNAEKPLNDGISNNMPGTADTDQAGAGPDLVYKLNVEDFLNVQPAPALSEGPGAQVTIAFYGNLVSRNPAHGVCIRLY